LKVSLATYFWHRGLKTHRLHLRQARLYFTLWLLSTALFFACAYVLFSSSQFNAQLRYLMPLAALCLFPLARIPLAALSLAHNRHR
jgi:hypothetical protein